MTRLTRFQSREIDKRSLEQYHIPTILLMENAARAMADHIWRMYARPDHTIFILCGGGNNGGDGLAVARHLHNRGASVRIGLTIAPASYRGDALTNWKIVEAMGLPVESLVSPQMLPNAEGIDLIVDAIFGTGLTQTPREPFEQIVQWIDSARLPVISIDLPSGLDCSTGIPLGPCIRATHTVTFVAEKAGFANPAAKSFTGEIIVADIGCPRELIDQVLRDAHL